MKRWYWAPPLTILLLFAGTAGVADGSRGLGDLNCDGSIDFDDIDAFVLALTGQEAYGLAYPDCDWFNGDVNDDGTVDFGDIDPFVALLTSGPPPIETQLAGNALVPYPHFEYVQAITEMRSVDMALDPTMFPEIVGQTADVYVVATKSQIEWDTDTLLTDVRPGGAQPVTFVAGGIRDNTFELTPGGQLSGDAGTGLGVGYDVVVDMNENGHLDSGDYIDGRGDIAGFHIVHDTTDPGPLEVTYASYSGGSWLGQRTWYPTDIADMGLLPLIVISHGNGHQYTWYDYLQSHLASYGYVVMSHENETGPGIESASTTTLTNTDYFLGHLSTIAGGIFDGHIDASRIVWIGHSRGGEGVARAYDRLFDGDYSPSSFSLDDIILVSSIAPTDFLGDDLSDPHGVHYHLIYGSADGDVGGYPNNDIADSFNVYERATGFRQATYVHGADHNDFNCCGFEDFEGPAGTAIGRPEAQKVAKGAYLALVQHYVEGNVPAKDFLWRQYESLHPAGVSGATIVDREYREDPQSGVFVIDDFQSSLSMDTSSSGGEVRYDVLNLWEGVMNDTDGSFGWSASDPMNGMTRARPGDDTRGVVFDWDTTDSRYLEFDIIPPAADFSEYEFLSLRACQGTRHPRTTAELEDLDFTVGLRDVDGTISSINISAYGGGIEEPYQRTGYGTGAGWQNEFETIRIRLSDFMHDQPELNLKNIVLVRFDFGQGFGPYYGSEEGRLALDDLCLSRDRGPGGLAIGLPDGAPEFLAPGEQVTVPVRISASIESYIPDSAMLHYRADGGEFITMPLVQTGEDMFEVTMPAFFCDDTPEFYFSAEGTVSGLVTSPSAAPAALYSAIVGVFYDFFEETFDSEPNPPWDVEGLWAFGQPAGHGGQYGGPDPTSGYTGTNVYGYNLNGDYENNLPERHLTTEAIDCTGHQGVHLSFWRWLGVEQPIYDHAYIRVSTNGTSWMSIWSNPSQIADSSWVYQEFDISGIADDQATVYIRWTIGTTDASWQFCGWNIDDVRLSAFGCE